MRHIRQSIKKLLQGHQLKCWLYIYIYVSEYGNGRFHLQYTEEMKRDMQSFGHRVQRSGLLWSC